ncbi:MAG TPA: hypothetical protein VIY48_17850 [Candidatus Paceibacterota bacterium]
MTDTPAPAPTSWWERTVKFFKDSETIFFARLQMIAAVLLTVLASMDLSPLVSAGVPSRQQWILYGILFAQGFVTEWLRRRRATDL